MKYLFTMLLLFVSQAAITQTPLLQTYCYLDNDGDGYGDPNTAVPTPIFGCSFLWGGPWVSNGLDCDDHITGIHPGTVWYRDADGDGFSDGTTITGCNIPPGGYKIATQLKGTTVDCDDNDRYAQPNQAWFSDPDNDGYINYDIAVFRQCMKPPGNYISETQLVENGSFVITSCGGGCTETNFVLFDCSENDPLEHPNQKWYIDGDGDKYTSDLTPLVQCRRPPGYFAAPELASLTILDCDDANAAITIERVWYKDADNDGFTDETPPITQCSRPANHKLKSEIGMNIFNPTQPEIDCDDNNPILHPFQAWYKDGDGDKHGAPGFQTSCTRPADCFAQSELFSVNDCNDGNPSIYPGATELCDGLDNNCNGQIDEGVQTLYAEDKDGDGVGNNGVTKYACSQPVGYVSYNFQNSDCNDNDKNIAFPKWYSVDADKDGYGQVTGDLYLLCAITAPPGFASNNTDCNDNNASINPASQWVLDADGDGYYTGSIRTQCSSPGNGYVLKSSQQSGDCNDGNAAINPSTVWYKDADNDGYYTGAGITSCISPGADYKSGGLSGGNDCNDIDPTVNPGAVEVCGNKIDDNCNGQVDEVVCYPCRNATGFSTTNITANTATVNWISIPNPEQWQLQYKSTAPGGKWIDVLLTGNKRSYTLTGLASRQTYNWHVRAKCGKNWTDYNNAVVFTTPGGSANRYIVTTDVVSTNDVAMRNKLFKNDIANVIDLQASAIPNPTNTNFRLVVRGNDQKEIIKISVTDMYGRIIEERTLPNEQSITLGDRYRTGVYMIRINQGKQSKQLKLVKF